LCDISFDEASVLKSLEKLRDDKAAGADELVEISKLDQTGTFLPTNCFISEHYGL